MATRVARGADTEKAGGEAKSSVTPGAKPSTKSKPKAASKSGKHGNAAKGKESYETYCWTCHGKDGKGGGPSAEGLTVKPRNHTDDKYMSGLSDEQIFKTIKEGGKAVGKSELMPAWGAALKDGQILDLVAYLRTLHKPVAAK